MEDDSDDENERNKRKNLSGDGWRGNLTKLEKSVLKFTMRAKNYQNSSLVGTWKVSLVKMKQSEQHHLNKIQLGLDFVIKYVFYACQNR